MAEWSPPRPDRQVASWGGSTPAQAARLEGAAGREGVRPRADPAPRPPRARRTPLWRRRPRLAVLAGFAVLVLATVAVAGSGAALTPAYGSLAPYRQSGVADLREAPHPSGWTTDLARSILPGVPVRCVSFASSPSSGRYVLLTGAEQPLGSSTGCSSLTTAQVESTLALFDGRSGLVRWTVDLRRVFPSSAGDLTVQQLSFVPEASRVLVLVSAGGRFSLATLSMATGRVTASVDLERDAVGQGPEVAGTLVLSSSSSSRGPPSGPSPTPAAWRTRSGPPSCRTPSRRGSPGAPSSRASTAARSGSTGGPAGSPTSAAVTCN